METGKNCYNTKKGKDNTDSKNFKAISLLPNISKFLWEDENYMRKIIWFET